MNIGTTQQWSNDIRPIAVKFGEHACDLQYFRKAKGSAQTAIIEYGKQSLVKCWYCWQEIFYTEPPS